jgi:hypothetical protein
LMDSPSWVPFIDKVEFKSVCTRLGVQTIATIAIVDTPCARRTRTCWPRRSLVSVVA